jgi:hypothetical protein
MLGVAIILVAVAIVVAFLIVTVTVMVVVAPIFTMVIIVTLVVGGAGSPFSFFDIGITVCCLYQFIDGCGPLVI